MRQSEKIVLLTGASGGLGTAIAKTLSKNNFKIYGTGRKPIDSPYYIPVYMDLTDEKSIKEAVEFVLQKEEKIDILINNAGIGITGSIEETEIDSVKKAFQVNLFGMMSLIQAVLPVMRKNNSGIIINISSIAGYTGLPFRGIYAATKAAVMRMTEALSSETKSMNIKVIDIAPGDFKTNIAEGRIYTELQEQSPYYSDYKRILKMIDEEVMSGLEPVVLGNKVEKILRDKSPALRYNIGVFMQKLTPFLTTCLSGRFFEKLIRNHYKMK
jgi:short-subunit dehydrogenase